MTAEGSRRGGLRKRTKPFTQTPNDTIDDWTISYRALGLLVRILRMPEGFVIRSEQLANEGQGKTRNGRGPEREGRGAVRTALRELALAGYYRLEKVRLLSGAFVMQNAISEEPDPLWAEQAAIFGGKYVPLYEQPDGSLMVRYPDGSMQPDGFPPPDQAATSDDAQTDDEPDSGDGGEETPGTGFRSPGSRSPKNAASGEAATGSPSPLSKSGYQDGQKDSVPASQVRRGQGVQGTIDGKDENPATEGETPDQAAFGIANGWMKYRSEQGCPVAGSRPQHQLKSLVLPFLNAGYTKKEIKNAMAALSEGIPSRSQLQRELDRRRTGGATTRVPAHREARRAGANVEGEWADIRPTQAGPGAAPAFAAAGTGGASEW